MDRKFKVGDRVKVVRCDCGSTDCDYAAEIGKIGRIEKVHGDGSDYPYSIDNIDHYWCDKELELVVKGEEIVGRRTFKLLKETPSVKKGALFQEACDDGTQEYVLLNREKFLKYQDSRLSNDIGDEIHCRDEVEKQPKWFEEVFPATSEWLTKDELAAFKKWQATRKKVAKRK